MSDHAIGYGALVEKAGISAAKRSDGEFVLLSADGRAWRSRVLILATGIRLNQVDLPRRTHEAAIEAGILRYCPVCDGFGHIGKRIGVVGCDSNGAAEALFLRQYSRDITLMPLSHSELSQEQVAELNDAGIVVAQGALRSLSPRADRMDVLLDGRDSPLSFDVLYPALGTRPRSELAAGLGVVVDENGCIPAGSHKETNVDGLFAAGGVVEGLDQISVRGRAWRHGSDPSSQLAARMRPTQLSGARMTPLQSGCTRRSPCGPRAFLLHQPIGYVDGPTSVTSVA